MLGWGTPRRGATVHRSWGVSGQTAHLFSMRYLAIAAGCRTRFRAFLKDKSRAAHANLGQNNKRGMLMRRRITSPLLAAVFCVALSVAGNAGAQPQTITVGRLTLTLCNTVYTGYCGSITRPHRSGGINAGQHHSRLRVLPAQRCTHPRLGTILPQEGGPGYSSTGTRDYYLAIFDALRDRRDVLIVDKRGTGLSSPIDCPALQTGATASSRGRSLRQTVGQHRLVLRHRLCRQRHRRGARCARHRRCGFLRRQLWHLRRSESSPVFIRSACAASFWTAPIRCARRIPGSPPTGRLLGRASTSAAIVRRAVARSAARRPHACSSIIDIVRAHPIKGQAPDGNGDLQPTTIDTASLIYLIDYAGYGPPVYRDLDAAARAWLDSKDALPLLRLVAEARHRQRRLAGGFQLRPIQCGDLYRLPDVVRAAAPRATRNQQYAAALQDARQHRPDLFAPFTLDEGIDSQVYITPLDSCLPWPVPPQGSRTGRARCTAAAERALSRGTDLGTLGRSGFHHLRDRRQRNRRRNFRTRCMSSCPIWAMSSLTATKSTVL